MSEPRYACAKSAENFNPKALHTLITEAKLGLPSGDKAL